MPEYISIIIPVLNANKYIERCLDALMIIDYPKDRLEIIVVDNGSSDNTIEIVKRFNVKILVQRKCTISTLRNLGAQRSKGEILAFIDADCIAPKYWLKEATELLKKNSVGAVGSWYSLPHNPSLTARIWDMHMANRRAKVGDINWVPSGNLIMPKEVFKIIGGFNGSLITSEDVDICERIKKVGYSVFTHPKLSVVHLGNPKNIRDFFYKEMWRGKGVLQNFLATFPKFKFNTSIGFAISLLFSLIIGFIGMISKSSFLIIFSLICIISVPFSLSVKATMINKKWAYFFPLMFLFLTFGISRVFSLFSFKAWKEIGKTNIC